MQDLVVYCNATQNQFYGDSGVSYNTDVFKAANPATTDNAINCCLRCAFSNTCNIWWAPFPYPVRFCKPWLIPPIPHHATKGDGVALSDGSSPLIPDV